MTSALSVAQSQAHISTPGLQQGISVEETVTRNAIPMPAADDENAWIVAVTADGRIYFGVEPMTPDSLMEKMRSTPRHRDAMLYIKADSRAPFAVVEKVLDVARKNLFPSAVLLTSQHESAAPGAIASPKGLEISLALPPTPAFVTVQINRDGSTSKFAVNNMAVNSDALQVALKRGLQGRSGGIAMVKSSGQVPFSEVALVIDVARSMNANVVLGAEGP
jgi:biopolymer transport protein ExbD